MALTLSPPGQGNIIVDLEGDRHIYGQRPGVSHLPCHWPGDKRAGQDDLEYSTAVSGAHARRPKLQPNTDLKVIQFNPVDIDQSSTSELRSSWSPKVVATSTPESWNAELGDVQAYIPTIAPPLSSIYSDAITSDSIPLFDFLRAVFLPQLIRPTAQRTLIDLFSNESLAIALRVPFFMHALLACCGAEILVEGRHIQTHYQQLAERHYTKAVAGLRANLDTNLTDRDGTVVLQTVIMLCIYERSKPYLSHGVDAHLLGMAQIIKVRFQQSSQNMHRSATDLAMDRVILEAFIFHTSTSIPFQQQEASPVDIDLAFSLAEEKLEDESHRTMVDHSHSPILGVPPRLFAHIREIALMYQGSPRNVDILRCYELMEIVSELETDMHGSHQFVRGNLSQGNLVYKTASVGPRLYTLASKLLLDRMICIVSGSSPATAPQLLEEAFDLVNQLQPSTDYYAEYYGWPFQVLGASPPFWNLLGEYKYEFSLAASQNTWKYPIHVKLTMAATSQKSNLAAWLTTDIRESLPEELVAHTISIPPFVCVPGTFNVRDLAAPGRTLRSGHIYRSGALTNLTEEGKRALVQGLGITTIFDLRNSSERVKSPTPEIPGIDIIWMPYSAEPGEINLKAFARGENDFTGFVDLYHNILDISGPTYRRVFEHIRDSPDECLLFHCTAGKDRTGVLAALILRLVGTSLEGIAHDYALTRVGIEPVRSSLLGMLKSHVGDSEESAGLLGLSSLRTGAIVAFIRAFDMNFGTVESYMIYRLGLTKDDVNIIKQNLLSS
ncbi:uncharacterized protein KD926_006390 [Aspergillus affinis]|uniref:uncharacterized protein n=1 Tax=Aspergillus affinis TaxID=1070780 RepID=UPI0022FE440D|nr:uncharacterized protein KD926_006390 [Aspergillus affinis]KAI9041845.1 hypothetical protein KD926_006390 [Aspergillus affinis]